MIHGSIAGLQETGFTYEHRTNKAYVGSNMLFFSVDDQLIIVKFGDYIPDT